MATTEGDYYDLLGVERGATDDAIKRAFRSLARELHPDVSDAPDAQERFRQVAEAYEVLSDPERRQIYDRYGHAGLRGGGFQPSEFDLGNLSDVFAAFFGEGLFGGGGGEAQAARGSDLAVATHITLADALTGIAVTVDARVAAALRGLRWEWGGRRLRGQGVPGVRRRRAGTSGCAKRLRTGHAHRNVPALRRLGPRDRDAVPTLRRRRENDRRGGARGRGPGGNP